MEEDRAIRLFVSGKIAEAQLDIQRKFITERLESARAKLDDYRAREASGVEKRQLMETILAWARNVGQGLDELTPEQRKEILQMVLEKVVIDKDNNVDITLAIPIDDESPDPEPETPEPGSPETESVAITSKEPSYCVSGWSRSGIPSADLPTILCHATLISRRRWPMEHLVKILPCPESFDDLPAAWCEIESNLNDLLALGGVHLWVRMNEGRAGPPHVYSGGRLRPGNGRMGDADPFYRLPLRTWKRGVYFYQDEALNATKASSCNDDSRRGGHVG